MKEGTLIAISLALMTIGGVVIKRSEFTGSLVMVFGIAMVIFVLLLRRGRSASAGSGR